MKYKITSTQGWDISTLSEHRTKKDAMKMLRALRKEKYQSEVWVSPIFNPNVHCFLPFFRYDNGLKGFKDVIIQVSPND